MVSASLQHGVDGGIVRRQVRQIDTRLGLAAAGSRCAASSRWPLTSVERVLQHRHHAEAEQIDLDDAHVGAVVLVPLHDDAAGHAGVLERHDRVELALADHHAAGVLAEMPRQVLHLAATAARTAGRASAFEVEADRRRDAAAASRPDR